MEELLTNIRDWRFTPGVTPFTAWPYPVFAVLLYLLLVRGIPPLMKNRKPFEFPTLIYIHNILLSFSSLLLGTSLLFLVFQKHTAENLTLHEMVCSKQMHQDGGLHIIYSFNHLLKYIELLDTIFLVLRKKPVAFLHTYHHAATLVLTWSQLVEHSTVQWVPIVLNLWVHVVMYYYYAMATKGVKIWWKRYLTTIQICQFVIDVVAIFYAYGTYLKAGFKGCYGTDRGAITGIIVLSSYLALFVRFYMETYSHKRKGAKKDELKKEL